MLPPVLNMKRVKDRSPEWAACDIIKFFKLTSSMCMDKSTTLA